MKRVLSILAVIIISCNNRGKVTKNEVNAVQQVLNFYGGECLRSKGVKSLSGNSTTYFEIEISKSELINIDSKNIISHSANVAYLFYSNLGVEKVKYNEIKVKVNLSNGSTQEFVYSNKELDQIEKLQPYLKKIIDEITNKNYEELSSVFDESVKINPNNIRDLFSSLEEQYGEINKNQTQGFENKKTNNFGDVVLMREILVLEKKSINMNLIFKKDSNKLISIEFE